MVTTAVLRQLHRIHRQLSDLRERQDKGPKQIKARAAAVQQATDNLSKIQGDVKAARVAIDHKQLLLKTGESKIQDLRGKLNACTTNREYQALKDQIAADEMANSVLADEILEALEKLDIYKASIAEAEQNLARTKAEAGKIEQSVRDQAEVLLGDVRRLEAELIEAEKNLPAEFREVYQRVVKAKGPDAMAEVEGEVCGGCCKQLTPNMLNELTLARVIFCKSCGRLLYLPEDGLPGRG